MSLFKAAVTGFAGAGAAVANKYLDQQLQQERAQFLADLQRKTSGQIREDDFAFKTDPTRVQATRDIAAGDVAAKAAATRDAEKAGWNDPEYQQGKDAQTKKETDEEVRKRTLFAQAEAKYRPRTPGSDDPFAKLPPAVRAAYQGLSKQAEQINSAIVKAQADGMWEPDKNPSQRDLLDEARVLRAEMKDLLAPHMPGEKKEPGAFDPRRLVRGDGGQDGQGNKPRPSPQATNSADDSQREQGPALWDRVKTAAKPVADALAPSMDAHAQRALAIGDKGAMRELLAQIDAPKPLSPAMRAKLEAAIRS